MQQFDLSEIPLHDRWRGRSDTRANRVRNGHHPLKQESSSHRSLQSSDAEGDGHGAFFDSVSLEAAWADEDGDGVLTERDGDLRNLVRFGVHSTAAYALR